MTPAIATFRALDGYRLHYRRWSPEGARQARVVALHGIQSHSGWYGYSSQRLRDRGHEVCFLDRRGSGLNDRDRGHANSTEELLHDVLQFLSERQAEDRAVGDAPAQVLLGVSWGGKLATAVAALRPDLVDGLALLYPGLRARVRATAWQDFQLSVAERLGIRQRRVPIPLADPALFTGSAVWQEFIRSDPLALRDVTVSFLLANRRLDRLLAQPRPLPMPVLLMLAGGDRIIENVATREYVERCAASNCTVLDYPEACHTLEFEPDRESIMGNLCDWVDWIAAPRLVGDRLHTHRASSPPLSL